jgi:IclR family pca regulon transcriptional regulator
MGRVLLAALPDAELDAFLRDLKPTAFTPKTIIEPRKLRRAILEVREQGYALVNEELEAGLRALAVPVRTRQGRVVAAINVGASAFRIEKKQMIRRCLPVLERSAQALSDVLL